LIGYTKLNQAHAAVCERQTWAHEILTPIGAGGMGGVYRVRNPRLNRDVAITVCAQQFSLRFEREAQAISRR